MEFIIALIVFILAFLGLASGVILYNRRIKGTCGGLGQLLGFCDSCDCKDAKKEEEEEEEEG
jgi:hypothetical protein